MTLAFSFAQSQQKLINGHLTRCTECFYYDLGTALWQSSEFLIDYCERLLPPLSLPKKCLEALRKSFHERFIITWRCRVELSSRNSSMKSIQNGSFWSQVLSPWKPLGTRFILGLWMWSRPIRPWKFPRQFPGRKLTLIIVVKPENWCRKPMGQLPFFYSPFLSKYASLA